MDGRVRDPPSRSTNGSPLRLGSRHHRPLAGCRARPIPRSLPPRGFSAVTTLQKEKAGASSGDAPRREGRALPFRPHVIGAVFKRNFSSYFSNPAGYVFITLFVFVSSWVAFWQPVFFTNNLANLAPLNDWMPYLLLFFIPAITMSIWAEERRQGTDELLFTLPAHDVEIVLGKYLAALGIYTVALLFTLTPRGDPLLARRARPGGDVRHLPGLLADGGDAPRRRDGGLAAVVERDGRLHPGRALRGRAGLRRPARLVGRARPCAARSRTCRSPSQFHDFGTGVVPLAGVFYFLSLTVGLLYLNMVLLGRRHWAGGEQSRARWAHSLVRVLSVAVALASLNLLVGRTGVRADTSAERLQHPLARVDRAAQADPRRSAGLHPGVLQPRGPARIRRDQGQPARPAQGVRRAGRRPDPPEPRRDRALLARGARRREAVRDRAPPRPDHRRGAAGVVRDLPRAWPSPRAWKRSSSPSSTAACPSSTS